MKSVVYTVPITTSATMSSTTATVSMKARSRSGNRGPTSASIPSAKAVSVDIATPKPCVCGPPGVHGDVDQDRHEHPAEPGRHRQREPPPLAQLAHVELATRLEPHDEEEERHQARVQPVLQRLRDAVIAEVDREDRVPDARVGVGVDVDPEQRGDRRREQEGGAAGLRPQERAQRRLEVARPRRPAREPVVLRPAHRRILAAGARAVLHAPAKPGTLVAWSGGRRSSSWVPRLPWRSAPGVEAVPVPPTTSTAATTAEAAPAAPTVRPRRTRRPPSIGWPRSSSSGPRA